MCSSSLPIHYPRIQELNFEDFWIKKHREMYVYVCVMLRKLAPARTSNDLILRNNCENGASTGCDASRVKYEKNESTGCRQGPHDCLRKDNATMINVGGLTNRNRAAGRICGLLAQWCRAPPRNTPSYNTQLAHVSWLQGFRNVRGMTSYP